MSEPTRIRAQMQGAHAVVRVLMSHAMESGQRKDASGQTIAAWFIQEVTATWNDKTVLTAEWGPAISKDPYLQFTVRHAKVGDRISIAWTDSRGERRTDAATVGPAA